MLEALRKYRDVSISILTIEKLSNLRIQNFKNCKFYDLFFLVFSVSENPAHVQVTPFILSDM